MFRPHEKRRSDNGLEALALLLSAILLSTGCYRVTLVDDRFEPRGSPPHHEQRMDFWLYGFVGEAEVDVRQHCGGAAATVRTGASVATAFASVLTLGIYTPRKVSIHCAGPPEPR